MKETYRKLTVMLMAILGLTACSGGTEGGGPDSYATVRLTADLSSLTDKQKQMIPHLIKAAREMDDIYWKEAFPGDRDSLIRHTVSKKQQRFIQINYGPWDRLNGDRPFVKGIGPKPAGAGFYPADMAKEEFERALEEHPERADSLKSLYTLVRRDENGDLIAVPYHTAFATEVIAASQQLTEAAALAEDPGLKRYLELRAKALMNDDYRESDLAWMDMKDNTIDFVVGPIETYEDQLFGYKAAHEAYVLIKDKVWSERLAKYASVLPDLQAGLPVEDKYKQETPGSDSDLNAYEAVYYAGQANAGAKTIAINLPNDEEVQLKKGTRRLQLKNAMRAKFDSILVPIANELISEDQRKHITFDAFFENTMFHEVAHGLGIKNTIDGKGTVREALRDQASAYEEGKADILGLYMITRLREQGVITGGTLEDNYVTFLASIFRSVRFGASDAHGRANMVRFNVFEEMGAFDRDEATGTYRVNFDKMQEAMVALSRRILVIQGDGDYEAAQALMNEKGVVPETLQADLDRLSEAGIPVDIVFEQGLEVLGLAGTAR